MSDLAGLFANNLLPIFLAAGAGYLLHAWLHLEARSLSQVIFYLFSPCLIFNLLVTSELQGDEIARMVLLAVLVISAVGLITWTVGRLLHFERTVLASVVLTSMFNNSGNYGLPVVLFAFKETALAFGSIYFVTNALLTYSLGVLIASLGTTSLKQSFLNLVKIPALYGMLLGLVFMKMDWVLPVPIERTTTLLGQASIPAMLVLLGMQFHAATWKGQALPMIVANSSRLLVAPALALAFAFGLQLHGPAYQAGVLAASMPAAVLNTVLATEYQLNPPLVTAIVFTSTLLSPLTLTPLLAILGG